MRRPATKIALHSDAVRAIASAAREAHPRETGGLLLGWWESHGIVVRDAVEVPDPTAGPTSWTREEQPAQVALESALVERAHPWLGYVGDWHSHTAPVLVSRQDEVSIRRASQTYCEPLLLLVYRSDGVFDHVVAQGGRLRLAYLDHEFSEGNQQR